MVARSSSSVLHLLSQLSHSLQLSQLPSWLRDVASTSAGPKKKYRQGSAVFGSGRISQPPTSYHWMR